MSIYIRAYSHRRRRSACHAKHTSHTVYERDRVGFAERGLGGLNPPPHFGSRPPHFSKKKKCGRSVGFHSNVPRILKIFHVISLMKPMAAQPWGQGGQMPSYDFLRGAVLPLRKKLSPPSSLPSIFKISICTPPPPVVRSRRNLKHKVTHDEEMICPPSICRGGSELPLSLTPCPPHMERFRRPWMKRIKKV